MKADAAFLAVTLCVLFVPAVKYKTVSVAMEKKLARWNQLFPHTFSRLESKQAP